MLSATELPGFVHLRKSNHGGQAICGSTTSDGGKHTHRLLVGCVQYSQGGQCVVRAPPRAHAQLVPAPRRALQTVMHQPLLRGHKTSSQAILVIATEF